MTCEQQDEIAAAFMMNAGDALANIGKAALLIGESVKSVADILVHEWKKDQENQGEPG